MLKKDVGLRIRIDKSLRDAFVEACRTQDIPASEVLREFMRSFTNTNAGGSQLLLPLHNKKETLK